MHAYKHLYVLCVYIFIYIFMYTDEYLHTCAYVFINMNICMYMLCIRALSLALSLARSRSLACSLALPGSNFYSHACAQAPTHAQDTHFEETIEEKSATSTQKSGALPQTLCTPRGSTREPVEHASRYRHCAHTCTKEPYIHANEPCIIAIQPCFLSRTRTAS